MLQYEEYETSLVLFSEVERCHVWRDPSTWKGMATRSGRSAAAKPDELQEKEVAFLNRRNDNLKPYWYSVYQRQGTMDADL